MQHYSVSMDFQIIEFSTLRIFSNDLRKSRDWYKNFFGVDPIEDSENFISFKVGKFNLDITFPDSKNSISHSGSIGYWLVNDLDALIKKIDSSGATIYRGPLAVPEIQRTIVQMQDPFGNVIGFEAPINSIAAD